MSRKSAEKKKPVRKAPPGRPIPRFALRRSVDAGPARPHEVEGLELNPENLARQKQERTQGLILGRSRDFSLCGEIGQEGTDVASTQVSGMLWVVEIPVLSGGGGRGLRCGPVPASAHLRSVI